VIPVLLILRDGSDCLLAQCYLFNISICAQEEENNKRVFGSVVVVAFQIAFRAEIHANDVFLFFKNHF
jgi:hypothetical protein